MYEVSFIGLKLGISQNTYSWLEYLDMTSFMKVPFLKFYLVNFMANVNVLYIFRVILVEQTKHFVENKINEDIKVFP